MHVSRKTNQELVLVDSSNLGVGVSFWRFAIFAGLQDDMRWLAVWAFWRSPVSAAMWFLFWRKEIVTFDAGRQQVDWSRRRAFKVARGTVPFIEITGIGMEPTTASMGR